MATFCTPCAVVIDIRAWNNFNTEKKQRTQGTQRKRVEIESPKLLLKLYLLAALELLHYPSDLSSEL